jgi:hypothetical protein
MAWYSQDPARFAGYLLPTQVRTVPAIKNEVESRALQGTVAFGIRQAALANFEYITTHWESCTGKGHGAPLGVSALACTDGGLQVGGAGATNGTASWTSIAVSGLWNLLVTGCTMIGCRNRLWPMPG